MIDVPTLQSWLGIPSTQDVTLLTALEAQVVSLVEANTDRYFGPVAPQSEVISGSGRQEVFLREEPAAPGAPIGITAGASVGSLSVTLASAPAGLQPRAPLLLSGASVSEIVLTAPSYVAGANPVALASPGIVNAGQSSAAFPVLYAAWRQSMQQAAVPFAPPSNYGLPATPGDYEVWGRKLLLASTPPVLSANVYGNLRQPSAGGGWPRGVKNLVFQYPTGYAAGQEPPEIRLAVTALVGIFYSRRGDAGLLSRESDGNASRAYLATPAGKKFLDQFPEITLALDTWRRRAMGGRL